MPLTPPRLDDLDHKTVFESLRARIPVVAPEWTDHNDSDPGITMLQLFSHLAEMVGYRLNRVPEKAYVEFLKLVGVKLTPAQAALTHMAFTLTRPERATGVLIAAGTRITAKGGGGEPPVFETDRGLDVLPAQLAALISTRHELIDINGPGDTGPAVGASPQAYIDERFSIVWDGKAPKLKDMPTQPVALFAKPHEATHDTLYLALAFNQSAAAGFKGARAALHLQLDDDEQPDDDASAQAGGAPLSPFKTSCPRARCWWSTTTTARPAPANWPARGSRCCCWPTKPRAGRARATSASRCRPRSARCPRAAGKRWPRVCRTRCPARSRRRWTTRPPTCR